MLRKIYRWQDLDTVGGLARIWQRQAAGLPEKDKIDPEKTAILFEEIYSIYKDEWSGVLKAVIDKVKKNLKPFMNDSLATYK